jgi:hypothetical protein
MQTILVELPVNRAGWTDTGIVLGVADSASIVVSGQGGVNGGDGAGGVSPGGSGGSGTYWVVYPEGTYEGLNGPHGNDPFPPHAEDLSTVLRGYFGLQTWQFIANDINAEMAVVGVILPDGEVPGFGWNAMHPETGTFYIGRKKEIVSGQHAEGRLWIIFNDIAQAFDDNYGTFQVQITSRQWEVDVAPINVGMNNPKFLIFNDSCISESSGSPRWANVRLANEISEVRRKFRSKPLWKLDLSGILLSPERYDELLAFQWVNEGMANEFLVRNARQCLFENFAGKGSFLGRTGGDSTIFQLRKERYIQGRTRYEEIHYPKWFYPPLLDSWGREWLVLPDVEIWAGGNGTPDNKGICISKRYPFELDRDSGLFDVAGLGLPDNLPLYAFGGYFTRMVCTDDEIPVKLDGTMFRVANGVSFSEVITSDDDDDDVSDDGSDSSGAGGNGDDDNAGVS